MTTTAMEALPSTVPLARIRQLLQQQLVCSVLQALRSCFKAVQMSLMVYRDLELIDWNGNDTLTPG